MGDAMSLFTGIHVNICKLNICMQLKDAEKSFQNSYNNVMVSWSVIIYTHLLYISGIFSYATEIYGEKIHDEYMHIAHIS